MKKFIILAIILTFTAGIEAMSDMRSFKLFQANTLFNQKQYEPAIKTYKEILLASKDEGEKSFCQKKIAEGYDNLGNFDEAAKEYEILIKNYPENPEINMFRERLAALFKINNDPGKQLIILQEMAEKEPSNSNYIFALGRFYEEKNLFDKAEELYEKKFELLYSNTDLQNRLFRVYEKRNNLDHKIAGLENGINQFPGKDLLRQVIVNFYLWQKKYSEAISLWEKNPKKDYYYFEALGNLYFESGKKEEAISIWKNIFIQNPNEETLQIVIFIFNKKGLPDESLNCYLEARNIFKEPIIYHREIFEIYIWQMRSEKAFEESLNLLNYSPKELLFVTSELQEILKDLKNPNFLVEKTETEISKKPESSELYQLLGEIYLETNQPETSISYFEKAGELRKNKEITLAKLGEKLINNKFYKEAIITFNKIKDIPMFKPLANYQIALSFYNLGDYDSSFNILNENINETMPEPWLSQSYALKAEILIAKHDLIEAKETLIKTKFIFRLAEVEFLLGNFTEAKKQFTDIVGNQRFSDFSPSANFYISEIYFLEDNFETAKQSFEDFAKRFPSEPETNKSLLRILLLNRNKENEAELKILTQIIREKNSYKLSEAEKNINDFTNKNPESALSVYFLMELGEIYSLKENWKSALDIYEKIKKIDSYFYKQEAVKLLAGIYEKNFKDTGKAREEYIKLLTDFPENPVVELIRKKIEELKP